MIDDIKLRLSEWQDKAASMTYGMQKTNRITMTLAALQRLSYAEALYTIALFMQDMALDMESEAVISLAPDDNADAAIDAAVR